MNETRQLLFRKAVDAAQGKLLLSDAEFAARMGVAEKILRRYRDRGFPSSYLKARVEACLDYQPIWSVASAVDARRECLEMLGFDPALITREELQQRCRERGVRVSPSALAADAISAFLAHFTVNKPHSPH